MINSPLLSGNKSESLVACPLGVSSRCPGSPAAWALQACPPVSADPGHRAVQPCAPSAQWTQTRHLWQVLKPGRGPFYLPVLFRLSNNSPFLQLQQHKPFPPLSTAVPNWEPSAGSQRRGLRLRSHCPQPLQGYLVFHLCTFSTNQVHARFTLAQ